MPSRPSAAPPNVELHDRLVDRLPGVERKGASLPYTSANGNMFSYLDASGSMALRLPAEQRAAFIEEFDTASHIAHGAVQREYVTVPPDLLADTDRLLPYFADSLAYALTLKPKATTKGR
jgi:hypothetical protein